MIIKFSYDQIKKSNTHHLDHDHPITINPTRLDGAIETLLLGCGAGTHGHYGLENSKQTLLTT